MRPRPVTDDESPAVAALRRAMSAGIIATVTSVSIDGLVTFEWCDNQAPGGIVRATMHEELADMLFEEIRYLQ
jgi:hypothetical protein